MSEPDVHESCPRKQQLIDEVQVLLQRLASLAHEETAAVGSGDDERMMQVDKEIETTIGEKERSMGALRAHRADHGC